MGQVSETMTALADEVRELSGTSSKKTIPTMTADIHNANGTIDEQSTFIDQLIELAQQKASGGGGTPTDEDLIPENIKKGVDIFGVVGTYEGEKNQVDEMLTGTITAIDSGATSVFGYACRGMSKIKTVNLPNATSLGTYAFAYCSAINSVNAPKTTSIGSYCFYNNVNITNVKFPLVTSMSQNAFYSCSSLEKADFPKLTKINQATFAYCDELTALILRKSDAICTLATATNAFQGSAIADGTGFVYVPSALIETYKTATNWSNYASQFRAIEDYPEITGG